MDFFLWIVHSVFSDLETLHLSRCVWTGHSDPWGAGQRFKLKLVSVFVRAAALGVGWGEKWLSRPLTAPQPLAGIRISSFLHLSQCHSFCLTGYCGNDSIINIPLLAFVSSEPLPSLSGFIVCHHLRYLGDALCCGCSCARECRMSSV